ncbi:MAG: imidazole glycerol phosphate synthase subunit HisH [Bacillota bacterium]
MIAIIDYGMGNLRSVQKALEKGGFPASVTRNKQEILSARGVILPGVGAFADAMENLSENGMVGVIHQVLAEKKPFLGICLGAQLMFEVSEENGEHRGLGIFGGRVVRLPSGVKVPHMGWNQISTQQIDHPLLLGIPDRSSFYFVHSYYIKPEDPGVVVAETEYGLPFASMVGSERIFGIQFHPEKSSTLGLIIMKNFGKLVGQC